MKTLTSHFQVTTPLFLGENAIPGDDRTRQKIQSASTLRPPSVKGALRFWWRALQWGRCLQECSDVTRALQQLHEQEATLFGRAADEDENHGQGAFLLSVARCENSAPMRLGNQPGLHYLLGQGLSDRGQLLRQPLEIGRFDLEILFKPKAVPENVVSELCQSLAEAVLVWGLLGGLGSRARKGFGSVSIQSLSWENCQSLDPLRLQVPRNTSELSEILQQLLSNLPAGLPPFTAFSKQSRIDVSATGDSALNLLVQVGDQMQFYRSNGQGGIVRGEQAERTFRPDHDLAENAAAGQAVTSHPRRVVFGLPHNYRFTGTGDKLNLNGNGINIDRTKRERRASPLLIHAHRFPQGECAIIQSLLPAQFLPHPDRLIMKGRSTQTVPVSVDWNVIETYMDRFPNKRQVIG